MLKVEARRHANKLRRDEVIRWSLDRPDAKKFNLKVTSVGLSILRFDSEEGLIQFRPCLQA